MADLTVLSVVALVCAAFLIGFAKTAIGGVASLAVAAFALVLPARESTGAVLALLLVGDVIAVRLYRRHADWPKLLRLLPAVVPGLVLGAWFVAVADEAVMQQAIGAVLLVLCIVQVCVRPGGDQRTEEPRANDPIRAFGGRAVPFVVGALAGFATMTANAAGSLMGLYLLMTGLPVLGLLGTTAWFFLVVNLAKLPFSASLDLLDGAMLRLDLALVPALLAGAAVGVWVARRIDRARFERVTLVLSALAGAVLII